MNKKTTNNFNVREEIMEYIVEILKNKFNIKLNFDIDGDNNFFGKKINLLERELVYLLFLSEEHYNMSFTEEEIDSLSFYSPNGFVDIIESKIIVQ